MTILNYKENELCIVHQKVHDDEEKGYLTAAIIAAIKWNSVCEDDAKYNCNRTDAVNVYTLVTFLETLFKSNIYENNQLKIRIETLVPKIDKWLLFRAIVAAFRWKGVCIHQGAENGNDANDMQVLAVLLEQMIEEKEIN